jgi:hypothetical protein
VTRAARCAFWLAYGGLHGPHGPARRSMTDNRDVDAVRVRRSATQCVPLRGTTRRSNRASRMHVPQVRPRGPLLGRIGILVDAALSLTSLELT